VNNVNYCSTRCIGYVCQRFRSGECNGVFSDIRDREGNVIYRVPPTIQLIDGTENIVEVHMKTYKEMEEAGYITKQDVIGTLATKYDLEIPERTLKYYGTEKLIEPGIKASLPGVTGSVSFYKKDTIKAIVSIKHLQKYYRFSLKDIAKYFKILGFKDVNSLERLYEVSNFKPNDMSWDEEKYGNLEDGFKDLYNFEDIAIVRSIVQVDLLNKYKHQRDLEGTDHRVEIEKATDGKFQIVVGFREDKKVVYFNESGIETPSN